MRVGRQELMPFYSRPEQKRELKRLAKKMDRSQQELLREAVDDLLKKYAKGVRS